MAHYTVALSGISSADDVRALNSVIDKAPPDTSIMMGFSVAVTMESWMELANRPNLAVEATQIDKIVRADTRCNYLAHLTPAKTSFLSVQVRDLLKQLGRVKLGIQINDPRRPLEEVETLHEALPDLQITYPLGRRSMRMAQTMVYFRVKLIQFESSGVTDLLLDNSSGEGGPLEYVELSRCLELIGTHTNLNLRVAGRLGGQLEMVEQLLADARFRELSFGWEVEERLRDTDDRFDVGRAETYLLRSFELINWAQLK